VLRIELEVARNRYLGRAIFGIVVGALLVWKLGTVGAWVGAALVAVGLVRAWQLARTFRYPAGTIVVGPHELSLPRGLCHPSPVAAGPGDVTAVYFLRRAVPWHNTAPVLVVELGRDAYAFPRDWFAAEADQRHVVHAILRHGSAALGGALAGSGEAEEPDASDPPGARDGAAAPPAGEAAIAAAERGETRAR
jgi:hypothetical protein